MLAPMQRLARVLLSLATIQGCLLGSAGLHAQQGSASSDALAERGRAALAAGHLAEAESAFSELARLQPSVAEVSATLGAVYFQDGKLELAIASLRRALRLKPSLTRAKTLLAICLSEHGDTAEALPGLEVAFRTAKDAETVRMCGLQLLRAYSSVHRDADAVTTALEMNKLYPDDAEVLYQTGRIFGNYTYLTMERLRDKAPDSIWTIQAEAEAKESQKQYEAALASYSRVLQMDPQRPGVHYRMGRVYLDRFEKLHAEEDRVHAAEEFRAELKVDAENSNAAYELAQLERDAGNLDQAEIGFNALVNRRPEFEQARVGLAGVLLEGNKAQPAVVQLRRAVELDPGDEVAWYRLAMAFRMTGDKDEQQKAKAEYQRLHLLKGDPSGRAGTLSPAGEVTPQQIGTATQP